jgi:hypothetical protein
LGETNLYPSDFTRLGPKGERKYVFKKHGVVAASKGRTRGKISYKARTVVNCDGVLNVITQVTHLIPCDEESVDSCNHITIHEKEYPKEEDVEYVIPYLKRYGKLGAFI